MIIQILSIASLNLYPAATYECNFCMIMQGLVIINLSCPTGNGRYEPAQLSTLLRIWALDMRNSDSPSLIHKGSPRLRGIRARDSQGRIQKITAR